MFASTNKLAGQNIQVSEPVQMLFGICCDPINHATHDSLLNILLPLSRPIITELLHYIQNVLENEFNVNSSYLLASRSVILNLLMTAPSVSDAPKKRSHDDIDNCESEAKPKRVCVKKQIRTAQYKSRTKAEFLKRMRTITRINDLNIDLELMKLMQGLTSGNEIRITFNEFLKILKDCMRNNKHKLARYLIKLNQLTFQNLVNQQSFLFGNEISAPLELNQIKDLFILSCDLENTSNYDLPIVSVFFLENSSYLQDLLKGANGKKLSTDEFKQILSSSSRHSILTITNLLLAKSNTQTQAIFSACSDAELIAFCKDILTSRYTLRVTCKNLINAVGNTERKKKLLNAALDNPNLPLKHRDYLQTLLEPLKAIKSNSNFFNSANMNTHHEIAPPPGSRRPIL